ncbi:acylphosphatase [uncultured Chitinophaga sp.]|uniref:acylphosphatase n=1 Tax=uncultured Chitinophaga sp. TaxID=339340 RepID=UPI0025D7CB17|nr:acylphosphatase [uncultured Chitinophaga sp.]
MIIHNEIILKGRVQGVYFRATAKSVAESLNVKGIVKNTPEGHVWIAAEAPADVLTEFFDWCKQGPISAEVAEWEIMEGPVQHYPDFVIGY